MALGCQPHRPVSTSRFTLSTRGSFCTHQLESSCSETPPTTIRSHAPISLQGTDSYFMMCGCASSADVQLHVDCNSLTRSDHTVMFILCCIMLWVVLQQQICVVYICNMCTRQLRQVAAVPAVSFVTEARVQHGMRPGQCAMHRLHFCTVQASMQTMHGCTCAQCIQNVQCKITDCDLCDRDLKVCIDSLPVCATHHDASSSNVCLRTLKRTSAPCTT